MRESHEEDGRFEDVTIGFVGGGSRDWAAKMMTDLATQDTLHGEVRLYDVDRASAEQNARLGKLIQDREEAIAEWDYRAVPSLADALDGADVVVLSTQDPPAETFAHDLDIPAEYGIYQSVGDTVGPGGTFRAMRAIPQYREIAAAIREHCPDAWVLNYTNPMTVCTRTLYEEFPDIQAVGLCHEVLHVKDDLAEYVEKHRNLGEGQSVSGDDLRVNVKGINHFTWIDDVRFRSEDVFDVIDAELDSQRPLLGGFEPGDLDDETFYVNNDRIALDLYRRFGIFPAAGDRHLAEFVPWYLNIDDPKDVQRWGIRLTPSEHRIEHWPANERERERYLAGEEAFEFTDTGEKMVDIMTALLGGEELVTNVNLPNQGQLSGVRESAVVETNALVTDDDIVPHAAGELPEQVRSMVRTHVSNQETLIEAGFDGDLDLAYRAFLNDPLVTLPPEDARNLFVDLVDAERPYLTDWNLDEATVLER
ncbi:glycoside hydrolase family 4 [Halorhabdus sp. BNX81]|uniref:family 4 glycosyl hydrolase n=1 Tax=Halorhabdus sp. BNX81 TaxID=2980181 RepID=UPI0023DD47EA|nr:glycoside hydrolase family 4 [Halorhabdus sp. BNX81]WEL21531.1 Alpha-galactosidase, glycosyl hydrolase family 4 [Halorhabdus sp. BNX81]